MPEMPLAVLEQGEGETLVRPLYFFLSDPFYFQDIYSAKEKELGTF